MNAMQASLNFVKKPTVLYLLVIILGIVSGIYGPNNIQLMGELLSEIFIRIFRCLSAPIIALSLIVTLSTFIGPSMSRIWKKTVIYTLATTIIAALTTMMLYLIIKPENATVFANATPAAMSDQASYIDHIAKLVPTSFVSPFIDNQVMGILLIGIVVGIAIRFIPDENARQTVTSFFKGIHSLLFVITKWVVTILPIGIYGFIIVSVHQYQKQGMGLHGIGQYFSIIVLANLIQGLLILPLWLKSKGIKPFDTMKKMMPALTVAFFSKSSAGTLPLTIETAEKRLGLEATISRFVLPLCTTVNMNGCAAFIFATVIYVMQNNGIDISVSSMLVWVVIATIAAVGNAGVPMGCFFLSASLLASMNIPIVLLGVILPFYGVIDMIETTLNVWSDSCVACVVNKEHAADVVLTQDDLVPEPAK